MKRTNGQRRHGGRQGPEGQERDGRGKAVRVFDRFCRRHSEARQMRLGRPYHSGGGNAGAKKAAVGGGMEAVISAAAESTPDQDAVVRLYLIEGLKRFLCKA